MPEEPVNVDDFGVAKGSLTVTLTRGTGAKAGHSDPAVACGSAVAQFSGTFATDGYLVTFGKF